MTQPSDFEQAEAYILNALLDVRRRGVRGGDLSRAQVEALRPYFDAALAAVRALALAMPPSPSALAGPEAKR